MYLWNINRLLLIIIKSLCTRSFSFERVAEEAQCMRNTRLYLMRYISDLGAFGGSASMLSSGKGVFIINGNVGLVLLEYRICIWEER